jgi:POT family proton-dependent oligopeptide transporter
LAVFIIGISFILMSGLGYLAEQNGTVQWEWLVLVFLIQVMAELLLSPTGLSATTQLAPRGMESQVLALWFLAVAVGDSIGGVLANLQPVLGNAGYFLLLGSMAVLLSVLLVTQVKRLRGLMVGIH